MLSRCTRRLITAAGWAASYRLTFHLCCAGTFLWLTAAHALCTPVFGAQLNKLSHRPSHDVFKQSSAATSLNYHPSAAVIDKPPSCIKIVSALSLQQ